MKFYEIAEPYYALLKAEDKERAKLEYNASVANLEDIADIYEVPEDYALARFSQVPGEDKKLIDPKVICEEFKDPKTCLLIIDGSLL